MRKTNDVTVKVPCSTSNLGSGFDAVSAALDLYLTLEVSLTSMNTMEWEFTGEVPEKNIIDSAVRSALNYLGLPLVGLRILVDNPIPLKRGLGSSGAAIIGGIKLAGWMADKEMTDQEILSLAYPLEGHPDNLSASLLGGWVISRVIDERTIAAERLSSKLEARFVVCIPEVEVSTFQAREILPENYDLKDVAFNLQRVSLLIHALNSNHPELLKEATRDRIHQPYRASLVPGLVEVLSRTDIAPKADTDLLSITLSGSGSTVLAIVQGSEDEIGQWMVDRFAAARVKSRYLVLSLDSRGAAVFD
jgi:homoserine kinase